ncbi:unnamed protein product [Schistosoma turkestanicum]|nr:unnamed protein product [Schistosoma turkestanicum]
MGDIACRTTDGNKCIPHKEFGTYTCQCITGFSKFINSSLLPRQRVSDNCLVHVDPCIVKPCKHGVCVMSQYGNKPHLTARCICDYGWKGDQCDSPASINVWSSWSNWSFCESSCHLSFEQNEIIYQPETTLLLTVLTFLIILIILKLVIMSLLH